VAISGKLYAKFLLNMIAGGSASDTPIDFLTDDVRLQLHSSTYAPNQSTHAIKSDATNELSTAGGYTATGQALASKAASTSGLVASFDAADVTWTALSVSYQFGVLLDNTIAAPVKPLIGYVDSGGNQTLSSTDLVFQWNNTGTPAIFQFTAA
jgi:hypothetical protein